MAYMTTNKLHWLFIQFKAVFDQNCDCNARR